ncbi:unnamed protein product, partial [Candidula unifasciata]
ENPNSAATYSSNITTTDDNNNDSNGDNDPDGTNESQPQDTIMDENTRVEEKLQQFKNDNTRDDSEDTKGTYSLTSEWDKQRRRNLIFDEERFEETFLKCLICREMYNEVDKLPKMLHCHHTFCMDCLYQMYRIQCPTCREGVLISEAELRRLPNDHTIMELLCFVSQTGKSDVQYCSKHQMQPLNFFCEPCIAPVCCDCTVIDHRESKGHVVVNIDEAMKKYTPIVEETLEDISSEKTILAEKKDALEGALEDLDQIQKNLNTQIRVVFDQIREVLSERERELYDVSESEIERKREILHGHMKVLMDRDSQLNSQFKELQKAKEDKDISLIFTGHKTAREVLSTQVNIPTNSTKGFSVTFQFSSRADTIIKQQVANLGDIIFQS